MGLSQLMPPPPTLALLSCLTLAVGCGRLGFDAVDAGPDGAMDGDAGAIRDSGPDATPGLSVELVYPDASDWNDYVERGAGEVWVQSGVPCAGTQTPRGYTSCLHGGEIRRLVLLAEASCAGLSATDDLGAFRWVCDETTDRATFYSTGLVRGMGLRDLVTATGFRDNRVIVTRAGAVVAATASAVWGWTNRVLPAPVNETAGDPPAVLEAGTIYVVEGARRTTGYVLGGDGIALVIAAGGVLSYEGTATNCDFTPIPGGCIVNAEGRRFLWLEGRYQQYTADTFPGDFANTSLTYLRFTGGAFVVIRNVDAANGHLGMSVEGHSVLVDDVTISNAGKYAVISNLQDSSMSGIVVANNGGLSTGNAAVLLENGTKRVVVTDVTIINSSFYGLFVWGSASDVTASHVSVVNSDFAGAAVTDASNVTLVNLVAANATYPVELRRATGVAFHNLVATNGTIGVRAPTGEPVPTGTGFLLVGDNGTDCSGGCGTINAGFTPGFSVATAFVGPGTPTMSPAAISRWALGTHRGYGRDSSSLDMAARGRCVPGEDCRPWDLRVAAGDVLHDRSGTGVTLNETFVPGGACPTSVDGGRVARDTLGNVFLDNALEDRFDRIGDDDGLCESDEVCFYSPNIGAHQGDPRGAEAPCVFSDGVITGVVLHGRSGTSI